MEYKELLFFKRTAELEHMTKAAEDLGVSQPFLSKSIANLENELGVKLFDNVGRGIKLNKYGESFYKHTIKMFNEAEDAKKEIQSLKNENQNQITIVTNCGLYMPGLLAYVRKKLPDLKITMLSLTIKKIQKMLDEGRANFAIVCPELSNPRDYEKITLMVESAIVIHPDNHWLKDYSEVTSYQLKDESFIAVAPGYAVRQATQDTLNANKFIPKTVVETTDTSSTVRFVKAGIGIALAPKAIIAEDDYFRRNHVQLSDIQLKEKVLIEWRKDQYLSPVDKQFIELAQKYFFSITKQYY